MKIDNYEGKNMDKEIDTIKNMKENGAFKKYIEYIVFPYYKNLVPGTKINLEFPITMDQEKVQLYMLYMVRLIGKHVQIFGFLQK